MNTTIRTFDIIIVGAGTVGLTLACGLRTTGKRIAVVEAKDISLLTTTGLSPNTPSSPTKPAPAFSAINRTSQRLFEQWKLWPSITAMGVSPFRAMSVWDATGRGAIAFASEFINAWQMGHIIQNQAIQHALLSVLKEANNVSIVSPASLADGKNSITTKYPYAYLTLDNGQQLQAELIIGADGARSSLRKCLGIQCYSWPYGQSALTATVLTERAHQQTAWQCFLPTGPLAFLPLADSHHCSIVWSTTPKQAESLQSLPLEAFNQALTHAFEKRLGQVKRVSALTSYPLTLRHAKQYTLPCIALVGDAIHTIHPLAGQGVNLGLKDVQALVEQINRAIECDQPLGHPRYLRAYERARKSDNWLTIGIMELFKRVFGSESKPIVSLRSAGLNATNRLDCIKRMLIN